MIDIASAGNGSYYVLMNRLSSDSLKTEVVKIDDNLQIQGTLLKYGFNSGTPVAVSFKNDMLAVLGNYSDVSNGVLKMFLALIDPSGNVLKTYYDLGDNSYDNLTGKTLIAGDDGIFYWCGENKKTSVTRPRFIGIDSRESPGMTFL